MALLLYLVGLSGTATRRRGKATASESFFMTGFLSLFDYTRNGLFFAPVFLMLGGFIADERRKLSSVEARNWLSSVWDCSSPRP